MTAQPGTALASVRSGAWELDPSATTCRFSVRDKLATTVHGTMPATSGSVEIDQSRRVVSAFREVGVGGIETGNRHQMPTSRCGNSSTSRGSPTVRIDVESTELAAEGATAQATLSARGTRAPLNLDVRQVTRSDSEVTLQVTGRLDRRPLGIRAPTVIIGRFVDLDAVLTFRRIGDHTTE